MERKNKRYPLIAHKHSKQLDTTTLFKLLSSQDESGRCVKYHSDIYLLLREKNLEKMISQETLRNYVDSLRTNVAPSPDLTDEELFQLIEPREVDNITDAYQFSRYLRENSDKFKGKYEELKKAHDRFSNLNK